jgi:hypothetical protein
MPVRCPFELKTRSGRSGKIGGQLAPTIENAKRDGVRVSERTDGSQRAGSIQPAASGQHLEFAIPNKPTSRRH